MPIVYEDHGIQDPYLEYMFFSALIGCMLGICLFYFQKRAEDVAAVKKGERCRESTFLLSRDPTLIGVRVCSRA